MSKTKKLIGLCQSQDLNVSLTWQKINDWSVEIYVGYGDKYQKIFYTDGHSHKKEALKKAIKFMNTFNRMEWYKGHEVKPREVLAQPK